jgi:acetoacetate decarboxylase
MFPNDHLPNADRARALGICQKARHADTVGKDRNLVGTLDYGAGRIATRTMGDKTLNGRPVRRESLAARTKLPAQDHAAGRRQPAHVRVGRTSSRRHQFDRRVDRPAALTLCSYALAPLAELPVREVVSVGHIIADLTFGSGKCAQSVSPMRIPCA